MRGTTTVAPGVFVAASPASCHKDEYLDVISPCTEALARRVDLPIDEVQQLVKERRRIDEDKDGQELHLCAMDEALRCDENTSIAFHESVGGDAFELSTEAGVRDGQTTLEDISLGG